MIAARPDMLEALPPRAVVAVGTFDGLHLGHRALLRAAAAHALAAGRPFCVLTFTGSPLALLDPAHMPGLILDRAALRAALRAAFPGAARLFQPFDPAFAAMPAEIFADALRGATVFCGEDWRFGAGARGDAAFLRSRGLEAYVVPYALWRGERVSSSRIRQALAAGRLDDASAMMGRPWAFRGTVVHGRGLAGPRLGVPTANLRFRGRDGERLAPLARGVYRATAHLHEIAWPALVNFGVAPSLKGEPEPLLEAHLIGAAGDLYGATLTLTIDTPLLRPERRFPDVAALRAQIHADLAALRGGAPTP